jgi:hypothetical protein
MVIECRTRGGRFQHPAFGSGCDKFFPIYPRQGAFLSGEMAGAPWFRRSPPANLAVAVSEIKCVITGGFRIDRREHLDFANETDVTRRSFWRTEKIVLSTGLIVANTERELRKAR